VDSGEAEPVLAVGLMSGTSMDGVDAALIRTDGEQRIEALAFRTVPYQPAMRDMLRGAISEALSLERPEPTALIAAAERSLTLAHVEAVTALLESAGVAADAVEVIGFHGQTIAHRPERGWTWQIGDGQLLADLCGADVVNDFRRADVEAGGQGAPLAPLFHRALLDGQGASGAGRTAVLNLGGVGNISWFAGDDRAGGGLWGAFDTGPGNALIDDWVLAETGRSCDEGGALAAEGTVHEDVLATMLDLPWFDLPPPKSLDRHDFGLGAVRGLPTADGAATLTAFTAESVRLALLHLPGRPERILVTGGGRHNGTLMRMLGQRTGCAVAAVEDAGWDGDALEAQAFAWLAVRALRGRPTSYPQSTGARGPVCGGRLHKPSDGAGWSVGSGDSKRRRA
jgi:anhydro-N-acetylmuramic acid kinase